MQFISFIGSAIMIVIIGCDPLHHARARGRLKPEAFSYTVTFRWFLKKSLNDLSVFQGIFNNAIIPFALIRYELPIIISSRPYGPRWLSIISYQRRSWNNCLMDFQVLGPRTLMLKSLLFVRDSDRAKDLGASLVLRVVQCYGGSLLLLHVRLFQSQNSDSG